MNSNEKAATAILGMANISERFAATPAVPISSGLMHVFHSASRQTQRKIRPVQLRKTKTSKKSPVLATISDIS